MEKQSLETVIDATRDPSPRVRRAVLHELCPCKLRHRSDPAWDRVLEMAEDPDPSVRSLVLHALCDGSPNARQREVVGALERLAEDPDRGLRRRARKVLAHYRRTGRLNIL